MPSNISADFGNDDKILFIPANCFQNQAIISLTNQFPKINPTFNASGIVNPMQSKRDDNPSPDISQIDAHPRLSID